MRSSPSSSPPKRRLKAIRAVGVSGIALALSLAACSSSSSTKSSSSATTTAGGGSSNLPDLAKAKAEVAAARKEPIFKAPGPNFDASKLAGKTVFNLPSNSTNPFYAAITVGMQQAATAAGVKMITYTNQGTTQQWIQGMNQAISRNVDAIVLGGINPKVIAPQIAEAKAKGIVVDQSHAYWPGSTVDPTVPLNNYGAFTEAAHLMATYAIDHSKGHVNALIITDNEYPNSKPMADSMISTLKELCGSQCSAKAVDVPNTNWASIQSSVASEITKNPDLNWVLPIYDSMTQFIVPAIQAKGATGKVSIASYNGTPFVLKYIAAPDSSGGTMKMDLGENPAAIGWGSMDQVYRVMLKLPPAKNEVTPLRLFDSSNISLTGNPPALGVGYGDKYTFADFEKMWQLKS